MSATGFRRLALVATVATYLLIFVGGLVRVSGAGMGCPDWPKCYGSWIPPLAVADLPPHIDHTLFNVTLTWIEYGNRLVGVVVGFLILAVAVAAVRYYRKQPRIVWPAVGALLLTGYQAWQGGQLVFSQLNPMLVSVHLVLAFLIAGMLLWVAYYAQTVSEQHSLELHTRALPNRHGRLAVLLWSIGVVQIILGTQVRSGIERAAGQFPLWSDAAWIRQAGFWYDAHIILGVLLAGVTGYLGYVILKVTERPSIVLRQAVLWMSIVVGMQILIGFSFALTELREILQLFHLWLAGIYIGLAQLLWLGLRHLETQESAAGLRPSRVAIPALGMALVVGLVATLVVGKAEASRSELQVIRQVTSFQFTDQGGLPFSEQDLTGRVSVVEFMLNGGSPGSTAMGELARAYAHSNRVHFISFTAEPILGIPPPLTWDKEGRSAADHRWRLVSGWRDEIAALCTEGFGLDTGQSIGRAAQFVLVDTAGMIRGYYDSSDSASMTLIRQHIKALARPD